LDREQAVLEFSGLIGSHNVKIDEPMKNHTSFKVGGPADILVTPDSTENLVKVFNLCRRERLPTFVIGNGTNLIVRDKGIRGIVIKVLDNLSKYEVIDDTIKAETGILVARLSQIALENELSGMEFTEGIPGTLGGAVAMNAGAYTGELADIVFRTEYLNGNGQLITLEKEQHQFGKRASYIQGDGGIAIKTEVRLKKGTRAEIKSLMDGFKLQRKEKQPLEMPSAGSIFKRPEDYFAGKLIQDCGLKGYHIGGAEVSCKHCGFIVNTGNATAKDDTDLINHIKETVRIKYGVELQTEVRLVGEE